MDKETVKQSLDFAAYYRSEVGNLINGLAKIPKELKNPRQWVVWKAAIGEDGKPTKHPYCPHAPQWEAKKNDPQTWNTFEKAVEVAATDGFNGVGFVFTADDPYTGVDLDKCRNPATEIIEAQAKKLSSGWTHTAKFPLLAARPYHHQRQTSPRLTAQGQGGSV